MLSDWAVMRDEAGLVLNWYGAGETTITLRSGQAISLTQTTDYPRSGHITIDVGVDREATFALKLRIPYWSAHTTIKVNGREQPAPTAGSYATIDRTWKHGDVIELSLDMSPHFWVGEKESAGKVSAYHGPLLLTWDRRFNDIDPDRVPTVDASAFPGATTAWQGTLKPILLVEVPAKDGTVVRLCDFASAGQAGSPYRSWLPIENATVVEFSRTNPLRSGRVARE